MFVLRKVCKNLCVTDDRKNFGKNCSLQVRTLIFIDVVGITHKMPILGSVLGDEEQQERGGRGMLAQLSPNRGPISGILNYQTRYMLNKS